MIYLRRCRLNNIHDFDDYPCKKCNGIILEDLWERRKVRVTIGTLLVIIGWGIIWSTNF